MNALIKKIRTWIAERQAFDRRHLEEALEELEEQISEAERLPIDSCRGELPRTEVRQGGCEYLVHGFPHPKNGERISARAAQAVGDALRQYRVSGDLVLLEQGMNEVIGRPRGVVELDDGRSHTGLEFSVSVALWGEYVKGILRRIRSPPKLWEYLFGKRNRPPNPSSPQDRIASTLDRMRATSLGDPRCVSRYRRAEGLVLDSIALFLGDCPVSYYYLFPWVSRSAYIARQMRQSGLTGEKVHCLVGTAHERDTTLFLLDEALQPEHVLKDYYVFSRPYSRTPSSQQQIGLSKTG